MTTTILTLIGGLLTFAFQLWVDYQKGAPGRKVKGDALRKRSLDELHAATDGVRGEGSVPSKRRDGPA